jgi:threonine aldolase
MALTDGVHALYTSSRDFRSDTVTTPTASMLAAMSQSSFGDDVYVEDTTTNEFEHYVAKLLGHEAGLFVSSGTMGNQLGLRMHLMQPPHSVLCDHRAHVGNYEAGAIAVLSQAMLIPVVPSNGLYLTLEDIEEHAVLDDDIHLAPTKVISLENTLSGTIMPLTEVRRISAWARSKGLKMHLDGARIWNAGGHISIMHGNRLDENLSRH